MDTEKFINQQLSMIADDFGLDQIKDNIFKYFVRYHLPNITLDALIHRCMEMYAEIIKRQNDLWIPISKKLPAKQGHYLIKLQSSFPKNYKGIIAEFYEDNQLFYGESSEDVHEDATHWKELPNADF